MKGFQLLAVTLFAVAFSQVVAEIGEDAELTNMFDNCMWSEAQPDKDITVAEIPRDCSNGFSTNFDLAAYNAVLKLVDCREGQPDWIIRMSKKEISLSIGDGEMISRPHPLYGPTEYLRMHIEYSNGYLAVSSHKRRIFLEFRALLGEDGMDPTFCGIKLGQSTEEVKISFQDPFCIDLGFPRPIDVQPDISRNTMRPIHPDFQDRWMMRCKIETTRNFLFILREDLNSDGSVVVVDAANDEVSAVVDGRQLQKANFLDQLERKDFLEILLIETDGNLLVLFMENNDSPVMIFRVSLEGEMVNYISYRTHGMEGRFTCYDPQEAIEIRIIDPPPPPPPSPTFLPSTTFAPSSTTEPMQEMECDVREQEKCLWYENRPTGTPSLVPDILTPEMEMGISMKISIASDCDATVIITEGPGQIEGLVLGFTHDSLRITYKGVLCRELEIDDLLSDRDHFVHFKLRFSNGFGSLTPEGPFSMITWNTGDEQFRVRGIFIESSCETTKFVFDPQPWGPPEIFGVIWEVGPVFIPEYPLPPLVGECAAGFEQPFEVMGPEGFVLLLQSGPSEQEVILSVGVYQKSQVWVKDTILVSKETPDLFTPGVFTKFVLLSALDRLMLLKVDPGTEERHVVMTAENLPIGLSFMGFAAVDSIAQLRFQRCRKINPIDIRIIPAKTTEMPPIATTTTPMPSSTAFPSSTGFHFDTTFESSTITIDSSTPSLPNTARTSMTPESTEWFSTKSSTEPTEALSTRITGMPFETTAKTPTEEPSTEPPFEASSTLTPTFTNEASGSTKQTATEDTSSGPTDMPTQKITAVHPTSSTTDDNGVNILTSPSIINTPLIPSGENNINELPEDRVPLVSNGDGIFQFNSLRSFDITNSVFFEFSVESSQSVWINLSPTDSYQPNGYLIGLNIDGGYKNIIQRCENNQCVDSVTSVKDVLTKNYVYYVEITSIFDQDTLTSLRIRFGYSINQVHTDILDFTDVRPLWISYGGFCTRDNFVGHFLIYNFIYEHGTMLRTFFQTNIHSYSVATSPLESKEKQINFGVKAEKSAVVALSASSSLSGPHYEIEIGAEDNTKTFIKYGGEILAQVDSINYLDPDNYVEFWISFRGSIRVGKVGSKEFLDLKVDNLPDIRYAFFQSGSHEKGSIYYWFVFKYFYFSQAMGQIFSTHDLTQAHQYHYTDLRREDGGAYIEFTVKSDDMVLVALSPSQGDSDGMIEIGIGAYHNRYIIVKDCRECKPLKEERFDYDLLDPKEDKHFVITVIDHLLRVFKKADLVDGNGPMFEWNLPALDETFFNYMGFSGSFMAHFHFHVYLSFEYKYYQIEEENVGKRLHLGVTASRDACIAIAGKNPDDSRLYEIVIAPEGKEMIQLNDCKGCKEVGHYDGDKIKELMNNSKAVNIWIQVSENEIDIGSFIIKEENSGRTMHDEPKFLSVPNTLGITAYNFGIAAGEDVQSHWFLFPYTL